MEELICNDCEWTGDSTMLECTEEDFKSDKEDVLFNRCPDCGGEDLEDFVY